MLSTRPVSEGRAKERIGGAIDEFLFLESEIEKLKKRKWKQKLSEVDENCVACARIQLRERDFTGK